MEWLDERCPECGLQLAEYNIDRHLEECPGADSREFDGTCPICGERYESYTAHVLGAECPG